MKVILYFNYTFIKLISSYLFGDVDSSITVQYPTSTVLFTRGRNIRRKKRSQTTLFLDSWGQLLPTFLFNIKSKQCLFCSEQLFKDHASRILSPWIELGLFKNNYCLSSRLSLLHIQHDMCMSYTEQHFTEYLVFGLIFMCI